MADSSVSLDGKNALVLGAGTPVGRRIAVALAEAGADVAVASSSLDGEEVMACRRTRRAVERVGRRSVEYAFDVTLGQNVQVSTRQVAKEMGGLDILVWAVHAPLPTPLEKITDAQWSRSLAVNLSGALFAARAAVREMLPRGWGRILLVIPGPLEPWAEHAAERTAQLGLVGLAHVLAEEFGARGISSYALGLDVPTGGAVEPVAIPEDQPGELGAVATYLCSTVLEGMNGRFFHAHTDTQTVA